MSSKIFSKKPIKPIDKVGIDKYNVGNFKKIKRKKRRLHYV